MSGTRIGTIVKLGVLFSLLTGCGKTAIVPIKPGVSVELHYPVLLAGERRLVVKEDEASLTSTTVASGLNFREFVVIDASGTQYSILKVTDFDRKSTILDMGTTTYRVFLEMKTGGKISLDKAKALVKEAAAGTGAQVIDGAASIPALIEASRKAWEWK